MRGVEERGHRDKARDREQSGTGDRGTQLGAEEKEGGGWY